MSEQFDDRKDALIDIVKDLPASVVRKYLSLFIDSLVTDRAGNTHDPFTYMWSRRFHELTDAMDAEMAILKTNPSEVNDE